MKKFSVLLLVVIAFVAINWNNNGVQAEDEENFEEGTVSFSFLVFALFLIHHFLGRECLYVYADSLIRYVFIFHRSTIVNPI
jgi:hypothetical protein